MPRRNGFEALRKAARNEAAALVRLAAGNRGYSDTIQACIARAAKKLGWPYGRTEDIWRREKQIIESFEMDALREFAREPKRKKRSESAES